MSVAEQQYRSFFDQLMAFMPLFHRHIMPALSGEHGADDSGGMGRSHYKVLIVLSHGSPLTASELGRCMAMTKASMTGLLDELESRRLVARVPDTADRRKLLVHLTDSGRAQAGEVMHSMRERLDGQLAALGPESHARLERAFGEVVGILRELP